MQLSYTQDLAAGLLLLFSLTACLLQSSNVGVSAWGAAQPEMICYSVGGGRRRFFDTADYLWPRGSPPFGSAGGLGSTYDAEWGRSRALRSKSRSGDPRDPGWNPLWPPPTRAYKNHDWPAPPMSTRRPPVTSRPPPYPGIPHPPPNPGPLNPMLHFRY